MIKVLIALAASVGIPLLLSANEKPNIVFLLTDDQTIYSLGCYGNSDVKTPHIDQLASDGMLFEHHYNTTAICMASRASIFTGLLEYRHGCNFGHGAMMRSIWEQGYPVLLRNAGYRTAIAGKIGIEVTEEPEKKGELPSEDFDAWGAGPGQTHYSTSKNSSMKKYAKEYPHSTLSYGAFGRDFIKASAGKKEPFCLSISFKAPHKPATPDPRFDEIYAGKKFQKPANYGRENGSHFSEQSRQGRQYSRFHEWGYADNYDEVMAIYHQQIYAVDVAVGMIRDAIREAGVADSTVIIFTSDNGFLCGSHGYGSKVLPYEEASKAPLVVYLPGHQNSGKGLRCAALTGNIDIHPTLLELADISIPEQIDGKSLLGLYDDPDSEIHSSLPLINVWGPTEVHSLSIVTKDWKFVRWPFENGDIKAAEELFFLSQDPHELTNEISNPSHESVLRELRSTYDKEISEWKTEAVPFHDYAPFGTTFQRSEGETE